MSDEWIEVHPIRGRTGRATGQDVTGAWRTAGGLKGHRLMLSLSTRLLGELGWQQKDYLLMTRNLAQGKVRLSPGDADRGFALTMKKASGIMSLRLDEVTGLDTLPAEALPFERQGSTLTLTLPDWAAPARYAARFEALVREQTAEAKAAAAPPPLPIAAEPPRPVPPPAPKQAPVPAPEPAAESRRGPLVKAVPDQKDEEDDDAEAMELMRQGKSVRDIQNWFGWHEEADRQRLVGLRLRLQAEGKSASAARR